MPEYFEWVALWIMVPVALFYLGVPLWIRHQQKLVARPDLQELQMQELDPDVADYLMLQTRELFTLGFDEPTLIQIPSPVPKVTVYLILLVNRPRGDKAVVTAIIGHTADTVQNLYLAFSTRFEDGRVFETLNTSELSAFPPRSTVVRTQTPSVTDTRELYALHRHVLHQHDVRARTVLFEPGRAVEYLTEFGFCREYEELARRGWLVRVEAHDYYQPTLKGAYLMTWSLLPPMKTFRLAALRRREIQLLAEFRRASSVGPPS